MKILLLCLGLLAVAGTAQARICPPGPAETAQAIFEAEQEKTLDVADSMINGLSWDELKECLDGIVLTDSINLGLPSLQDLIQQICDTINQATREALADAQAQLRFEPLPGFVSVGASQSVSTGDLGSYPYDLHIDTRSTDKSREILDAITR